jgi:hypothetical protein
MFSHLFLAKQMAGTSGTGFLYIFKCQNWFCESEWFSGEIRVGVGSGDCLEPETPCSLVVPEETASEARQSWRGQCQFDNP